MNYMKGFRSIRKLIILVLINLFVVTLFIGCSSSTIEKNNKVETTNNKKVTDLSGRTVTIPGNITKVAALVGPSYEKMIMLGQADKISISMPVSSKWAKVVAPVLKNVTFTNSFKNPNIEDLLAKKIQVAFFWDYTQPLNKMTSSKIPVLVTQESSKNPTNINEFVSFEKREVQVYGNALGSEAKKKADKWCKYFDEKVKYVTSRTQKLKSSEIPKVYYVRGPDALTVHGRNSYTEWFVKMAGGDLVTKDTSKEIMDTVTMEQVSVWNLDVIFMGRVDNTGLIIKDPRWSNIKAVKNGKVFVNPEGVFYWDYSSEGPLLMEFIAKTLHPDLFKDLNMIKEIKNYYSEFYNYNLTDDQANRILNHMPPAN